MEADPTRLARTLIEPYSRRIEELDAENAKLRELVRDMWRDKEALSYGLCLPTKERMRELGIEVDE